MKINFIKLKYFLFKRINLECNYSKIKKNYKIKKLFKLKVKYFENKI
jgi:hypothetical protein